LKSLFVSDVFPQHMSFNDHHHHPGGEKEGKGQAALLQEENSDQAHQAMH